MKKLLPGLVILLFFAGPAQAQYLRLPPNYQSQGQQQQPPAPAPQYAGSAVVLELFTSQNCPSCPPADEVFNSLADRPDIIALACHVTYFNTAQWRDTLSHDFCTQRQGHYNQAMGRGMRVFTPQVIINGNIQVNGADRESVSTAIMAATAQKIAPITLSLTPDNTLDIALPQLATGGRNLAVRVMGYRKKYFQPPGSARGMNGAMLYANAVNSLDDAGPPWAGEPRIVHFHLDESRLTDAYAVIAEDPATGHIVAAGRLER